MPPIGSIDFYGLHNVTESAVRRAVGLAPGDVVPDSAAKAAILARLRTIPGVQDAQLFAVCCGASGRSMLFVGIAEPGTPRPTFRSAPTGTVRLPAEIIARDSVFSLHFMDAVRAGRGAEVDSGGHEFFADSALNAIQHEYLAFAATRIPLLRDVLAHSASSEHRAFAAELLDYAPDVRTVIPDLVAALRDPVSEVRNAAMRALWAIAAYGQKEPALGVRVPAAPFISMLWSLDWTDRNKSSMALWQLTVSRDSTLLAELRARALRPLLDIARWSDIGHALPGIVLLSRIEGRSDQQISAAVQRGDRTAIIEQAEHMLRDGAATTEWTAYAHDAGGSKYSPAAQITRENVKDLVPIWTYRTGDFSRGDATARDETTPLYVDGVLYASTPFGGVRALNAESGDEIWSFDSGLDLSGRYGDFTNRGVSTWVDRTRPVGSPCRRRIFVATVDARLIALDARSGSLCSDFGERGELDLTRGVENVPQFKGEFAVTSPPAVVRNLVIVGATVADNQRAAAPAGVVRAFDPRTGALRWSWDPVPRHPSDSGYDTWRGPSAHLTGAANAWSIISADSARDLVFVPTGSASPDFYGGERLGENLYANSVVALRASTGKMVWHFQVVHHDLWDYDVPAEPVLFTMHRNGRAIPAVVVTTKMGYVFVLDRLTGKPLFPVVERPVPKSDVPGEEAWPTQPVPTLPAPLGPTRFDLSDVFGVSDSSRAWCKAQLDNARSEGIFTPPSLRGTVIFPGNIGGSNWSGIALDPVRHLAVIPSNRLITVVDLIPRAQLHSRVLGGTRFDEFAPQAGTPYGLHRRHLLAPDGVPCNPPPWGVLTAIDLESGATRWARPFGSIARLGDSASTKLGSPNLGGAMITAGGVVFAGGAVDQRVHAYDVETGTELWSFDVPAGVHASPMTFVTPSGTQFLVVAAGGHRELRDKVGDYIVAFALNARAQPAPPVPPLSSAHYEGHIILDRTRSPVQLDLTIRGDSAGLTFATSNPRVEGHASGHATRDSILVTGVWSYPAQHCSGTIQMRGSTANRGRDLIGELEYLDGCGGNRTKPGTFAVRASRVVPGGVGALLPRH